MTTRLFTYGAQLTQRNLTVKDLIAAKGKTKFSQVTAVNYDEANAAQNAGVDLIVCDSPDYEEVRRGAPKTFITSALPADQFITPEETLKGAIEVMARGSDAVYSCRAISTLKKIADEGVPVMSHIGMNPRKSTWYGGLKILGKTAQEAQKLLDDARKLEDAGCFAVEAELVAEEVLAEISERTSLVTFSIGAGAGGDVMFLYTDDICGAVPKQFKHAKAYGDLYSLQQQIQRERQAALSAFHNDVKAGTFPTSGNSSKMSDGELLLFKNALNVDANVGEI